MKQEVINLGKARKERAREDARRRADENAALHGLTRVEKALAKARREQQNARFNGHKLDE
jgi:Domain of unknown function (DUF4169)